MKLHLESDDYQPPKWGLIILQVMVVALMCAFAARFWYLQVHKGNEFTQKSKDNIQRYERTYASRGLITDSKGVILAGNRPTFALALNRDECHDLNATLTQISEWSGTPLNELMKKYRQDTTRGNPFDAIIICPELTFEQVAVIEGELVNWPELEIVTRNQRFYPFKEVFAHILGYVAEANAKELRADPGLALGDNVGKLGLEYVFEKQLRGEKGKISLEVDVLGRVLNRTLLANPTNGSSLQLTIDSALQQAIYTIMGNNAGSIVVLDPHTGEIRAMVTTPAYDNNPFVAGIGHKAWSRLRKSPYHPMQNRVIQSAYPPGSVWKLMMAGLFMQEGVSPEQTVYCNGTFKVGKQIFRCWNHGGHGSVGMKRSIVESCDVYYYALAEQIGIAKIEAYARACGFGRPTGIDLPHENAGLVPSKEWKLRRRREGWFRGDTVNVSIGQGSLLTTPLQIAMFIGSLLNGGVLMKPHLIAGLPPEPTGRTPMTGSQRRFILNAMHRATMPGGTAKAIGRNDAEMGGKTGTAQVVKIRMIGERRQRKEEMAYFERDHAWFASWGRHKGQEVVVVVMVEHGGGGGAAAGPLARKVYDILFGTASKPAARSLH